MTVNAKAENEKECFEKVSRGIFEFNRGFDNIVLKPVAKVYNKFPEPVKKGTSNFTSNIATSVIYTKSYIARGNEISWPRNWKFFN